MLWCSQTSKAGYLCRLDIPKAPQLLANLHAQAIGQGAVPIGSLQQACAPVEDVELRRSYAADVLLTLQACLPALPCPALPCPAFSGRSDAAA